MAAVQSSGFRQIPRRPGGSTRNSVSKDGCCLEVEALITKEIPRARGMHLSPYELAAYFDGGGDGLKNEVNQTAPHWRGSACGTFDHELDSS